MSSNSNSDLSSPGSDVDPVCGTLKLRDLVLQHGVEIARRMATTKAERAGIDAAAAVLPENGDDLAIGSLPVSTLPHKSGAHIVHWEQTRKEGTYVWQGGVFDGEQMGVPYGAKGRMVLIYLLTEAFRTGSLVVEVGSSTYKWARTLTNNAVGGTTYKVVLAHSRRIAVSHMTLIRSGSSNLNKLSGSLDDTIITSTRATTRGTRLRDVPQDALDAPDFAILNEGFYRACKRYLVPVRLSALRQISNNSAGIDVYLRLAWYLPRLSRPRLVEWPKLVHQFGMGYKHPAHMKAAFVDTLRLVLAVYREARVDLVADGMLIYPSPAPISPERVADQTAFRRFGKPVMA